MSNFIRTHKQMYVNLQYGLYHIDLVYKLIFSMHYTIIILFIITIIYVSMKGRKPGTHRKTHRYQHHGSTKFKLTGACLPVASVTTPLCISDITS